MPHFHIASAIYIFQYNILFSSKRSKINNFDLHYFILTYNIDVNYFSIPLNAEHIIIIRYKVLEPLCFYIYCAELQLTMYFCLQLGIRDYDNFIYN